VLQHQEQQEQVEIQHSILPQQLSLVLAQMLAAQQTEQQEQVKIQRSILTL